MRLLDTVTRFLIFFGVLSLPLMLLGWIAFGFYGLIIAPLCVICGIFATSLLAEKVLLRRLGAVPSSVEGLARSFSRAVGSARELPHLYIFQEPSPNAYLVKSWGSSGAIILSQGLLQHLNEEELRAAFVSLRKLSRDPHLPLLSVCSILSYWVFRLLPDSTEKYFLSEQSPGRDDNRGLSSEGFFFFILLFPWVKFFISIAGQLDRVEADSTALRKIELSLTSWRPQRNFYWRELLFHKPPFKKSILSALPGH